MISHRYCQGYTTPYRTRQYVAGTAAYDRHRYGNDRTMAYDRHRHGKDYIISMFMESIYLSRKYWQNLQPVNLNKEKTFPHLHCMEASLMAADKSSREYGRAQMADDLCQVIGPISDESVCKILEERFHLHSYHTFIGPTLIALNPQTHRLPDKALNCKDLSENLQLLANNVIEDVMEKKQSQSIIVSGESGSGKTKISMEILRHLYNVVGGGSSTDAFKLISAAVTAIRPFDMTATPTNQEASRSCWCVECSISSHAVTSTRITLHCLPRNRLTDRPTFERGYDIFYMVLIGMSSSEREHCHLVGQDEDSLVYLQNTHRKPLHARKYQEKYSYWKSSLLTLGIHHLDVLKVLAAVLLIGNFSFTEGDDGKVDLVGNTELQATATLLGVPVACLYQALTGRTVYTQRRYHRAVKSIDAANKSRHLLAESLFSRLFQHLLRKINQTTESHTPSLNVTKKDGKLSTGSLDAHSIYIIDCLAFQNTQGTQLERLCSNIGAEAIQHFYNMHMFHQLLDSYDDDNISIQSDIRWYDNSSTIQLLSQQNVGLVSLISSESKDPQPRPRSLIRKLEKLHSNSVSLELNRSRNLFTIQHFGGRVMYDSESLLLEDRNSLDDDVIALFSKQSTHFSLLSKLYSKELKDMEANGGKARGANYRVLSCQTRPYDTKQSSHSQDFLFSIDRLMQTLACSNSTFIRCIKASLSNCARHWDADFVKRQMMVLEVTETVKLLAGGLPHRLSYKQFISKYKCLICCRKSRPSAASTDYYQDCCQEILHQYLRIMESKSVSYSSANWVFGQKHIFLSDDSSRQLDMVRNDIRQNAACKIQSVFKGWLIRQSWPSILAQRRRRKKGSYSGTSYDSGYNTPLSHKATHLTTPSIGNMSVIEDHNLQKAHTNHLFQWKPTFKNMQEMEAPSLPEKRKYSVQSGLKVYFPQVRVMRESVNVEGYELPENCEVHCIGYSSRPSHVSIAFQNDILDVPFEKTSIRVRDSKFHRRSRTQDILATDF